MHLLFTGKDYFSIIIHRYFIPLMIKLTKDQIKEIADQLECGNRVYLNKETGIIIFTPDFDSGYADEELWEDDINELEENWDKYIEIDRMEYCNLNP